MKSALLLIRNKYGIQVVTDVKISNSIVYKRLQIYEVSSKELEMKRNAFYLISLTRNPTF